MPRLLGSCHLGKGRYPKCGELLCGSAANQKGCGAFLDCRNSDNAVAFLVFAFCQPSQAYVRPESCASSPENEVFIAAYSAEEQDFRSAGRDGLLQYV